MWSGDKGGLALLIAGADVFLIARSTGTSSDMIERFYGQVKLERMAK